MEQHVGVDVDKLAASVGAGCADAALDPASFVVFVIDQVRPPGTTPVAYLQPEGVLLPETVAVFQAVGAGRLEPHRLRAHRLAIWRGLPGIPPAALGPMLRHEIEHARRFERSGPAFFDLDQLLRGEVDEAAGEGYASLPSEQEANFAASLFARRTLTPAELAEMGTCADCAGLLDAEAPAQDVVAATLEALGSRVEHLWLKEARAAVEAWSREGPPDLRGGRRALSIEVLRPLWG